MDKEAHSFAIRLQNRRYSANCNQGKFEVQCKDALVRRLNLERKLQVHDGCVNTINWDSTGRFILSGSDDLHLVIADPFAVKRAQIVAKWRTPHRSNIFSAEFLPDSTGAGTDVSRVVSASCDGLVCVTDLNALETHRFTPFGCHSGTVYQVHTLRNQSSLFFSCSEDGTLRQFDLREPCTCRLNASPLSRRTRCRNHVVIDCGKPVTALAVSPTQNHVLGLAVADGSVRLYDRRIVEQSQLHSASTTTSILRGMVGRFSPPCARDARSSRITALQFAPDGLQLLASYYGSHLYLVSAVESVPDQEAFRMLEELSKPVCNANRRSEAPSVRRIRLRGDWSDTGPSALPEADRQRQLGDALTGSEARARVMDRFSDLLTGLFDVRARNTAAQAGDTPDTSQQALPSTDVTRDSPLDNRNDTENEQSEAESTRLQDLQRASSSEANAQNDEARRTELKRCVSAFRERRRREAEHLDQLGMLKPINSFTGHRNSRTMIKKATFWGNRHVLSGSDCGHVFMWDRYTASVVGVLEADRHVVNSLQPHPHLPLLATSGIDYDVKLWTPCSAEPPVSEEKMSALVERNARMLQETAGTYTLPSALIIRMLAAIRDSRMRSVPERRVTASDANAGADASSQPVGVAQMANTNSDTEENESDEEY